MFDESKYSFFPIQEAIVPPSGLINHLKDHWWIVHPDKGLLIFTHPKGVWAPQCNSGKNVIEHIIKGLPDWAQERFIPSVFHKINPHDYVF